MTWDGVGRLSQRGSVTVSLTSVEFDSAVVVYPDQFPSAPRVQLTVYGTTVYFPYLASTPGSTSMTVGVRHYNDVAATNDVTVFWEATVEP